MPNDLATTTRRGLLPKLSGSASEVLLGTGAFAAVPAQTLDSLSDVTITTPATGATLIYNGAAWIDGQLDLADADAVTGVLAAANGGASVWASWTPTRTGWTDVGSPTVTARYCTVGKVCFIQIKVVPGTTVATAAGTSYTDLPVAAGASGIGGDGSMGNITTFISIGNCIFDMTNSRCYMPTQGATTATLEIAGWYEI